jgi:hypothetical protein
MAERMEVDDPQCASLFKRVNEENIPPDEESLQWGMAYVTAQQAMMELMTLCTQQGRVDDGLIISHYMLELNEALSKAKKVVGISSSLRELIKEVKF